MDTYHPINIYSKYNKFDLVDTSNSVANCHFAVSESVIPDSKYLFISGFHSPDLCDKIYYDRMKTLRDDIVYLVLFSKHDSKIERFPSQLQYLNLGYKYNHILDTLPYGLSHLVLYVDCNIPRMLDYLPDTLEFLMIKSNYNRFELDLDNLPINIEYLSLIYIESCRSSLDFLPLGLKCLVVPPYYGGSLNNLPPTLEILDLYGGYEGKIDVLPETVKAIIISLDKGYDIADQYVHLVVGICY